MKKYYSILILFCVFSCQSKTVFRKEIMLGIGKEAIKNTGLDNIWETKILKYATLNIYTDSLLQIDIDLGYQLPNNKGGYSYFNVSNLNNLNPKDSIASNVRLYKYLYQIKIPRISKGDELSIGYTIISENNIKKWYTPSSSNKWKWQNIIIDNGSGIWCSRELIDIYILNKPNGKIFIR